MVLTNITCPECKTVFSVGIDIEKGICTAKECPKCKLGIELDIKKN